MSWHLDNSDPWLKDKKKERSLRKSVLGSQYSDCAASENKTVSLSPCLSIPMSMHVDELWNPLWASTHSLVKGESGGHLLTGRVVVKSKWSNLCKAPYHYVIKFNSKNHTFSNIVIVKLQSSSHSAYFNIYIFNTNSSHPNLAQNVGIKLLVHLTNQGILKWRGHDLLITVSLLVTDLKFTTPATLKTFAVGSVLTVMGGSKARKSTRPFWPGCLGHNSWDLCPFPGDSQLRLFTKILGRWLAMVEGYDRIQLLALCTGLDNISPRGPTPLGLNFQTPSQITQWWLYLVWILGESRIHWFIKLEGSLSACTFVDEMRRSPQRQYSTRK